MEHLPDADEQRWLVSRLAALTARRGTAPFLEMPIVEPTPRFFPDPWSFSHQGLDRVVRRLMQYAGLGDLDIRIGTYRELGASPPDPEAHGGRSSAGLFLGIVDGRPVFAFNEVAPADAEYMAGVMAHEVAHAYRTHHGLVDVGAPEDEELDTDVTAAFLGFGILAANNSFRCRTESWNVGPLAYHSWSTQRTGYLTPQAFSFLLAVQMLARDLHAGERTRLLRHLEPDQAAFTRSAFDALRDTGPEILRAIGVSPDARKAAPKGPEEILEALEAYARPEPANGGAPARVPRDPNADRPVFRVRHDRVRPYGLLGFLGGLVAGSVVAGMCGQFWIAVAGVAAGVAIGVWHGGRTRYEVCSDPECESMLGAGETCPGCGRFLAGTIANADDRLEAEEAWERKMDELANRRPSARKIRGASIKKDGPR